MHVSSTKLPRESALGEITYAFLKMSLYVFTIFSSLYKDFNVEKYN